MQTAKNTFSISGNGVYRRRTLVEHSIYYKEIRIARYANYACVLYHSYPQSIAFALFFG